MVEPQLTLHLFVDALGAISFLEETHELLLAHRPRQRRQRILGGRRFAIRPFDEQPERFATFRFAAVVVCDFHAREGEARAELASPALHRAVAPRDATKRLFTQLTRNRSRGLGVARTTFTPIQHPHRLRRRDPKRVVEAEHAHRLAKVVRVGLRRSCRPVRYPRGPCPPPRARSCRAQGLPWS